MALTLAKDEKIIKQYDYSTSIAGKVKGIMTESRLLITNKRVVEEKVCYARKNEKIIRNEMPLEKAKRVTSSFRRKGNALWLLLGLISAAIMVIGFASATKDEEMMPLGVVGLIAAVAFVLIYVLVRKSVVTVDIWTDTHMTSVMKLSSATKRRFGARQVDLYSETVKVKVDPEVAMKMVDEIGAIILDAQNKEAE